MYADDTELTARRKSTARILCLVAAVFVIMPCLGLHWLRAPHQVDVGMSLLSLDACGVRGGDFGDDGGGERCLSMSNFAIAKMMRQAPEARFEQADGPLARQLAWWMREAKESTGAFAAAAIATLILAVASGLALAAAAVLAFKDRFVRRPIALTSLALMLLLLSLVAACIFIGAKPEGLPLGVSWPFFIYALGVVLGIAGAQMLSKSFSQVIDPYWDGLAPEPPV